MLDIIYNIILYYIILYIYDIKLYNTLYVRIYMFTKIWIQFYNTLQNVQITMHLHDILYL